ncbi:MAG: hypothetical protein DRI57_13345 [Deltaproteobacteria bacterium]|nr:MAG: hypothetical protein DRI57_13345 [Deltaproteobacteria bacterium]
MIIATVVEGKTDHIVLVEILKKLLPAGKHRYLAPLQPTKEFHKRGKGWKGVRNWCKETWQEEDCSLKDILSDATGPAIDMLVIHVDADIAAEHDLQEGTDALYDPIEQPCPPIQATIRQLRRVIMGKGWLNSSALPRQIILAIPAQDTENWTFAALFPENKLCAQNDYECIRKTHKKPGYKLSTNDYGKFFKRKGREIKKPERVYNKLAPQIAEKWDKVCAICSQAQQFTQDVRSLIIH